jgi:replicative DNA helicase
MTDYLKVYIEDYLRGIGVTNLRKPFHCLNPEHADNNPSMSYDKKRKKAHCFACKADYDIYDLVRIYEGLTTLPEQKKSLQERYGEAPIKDERAEETPNPLPKHSPEKIKAMIHQGINHVHETDYFINRGLTPETITRFKLGYGPGRKEVLIPIGPDYFIRRSTTEKKYFNLLDIPVPIFNEEYITRSGSEIIFITESAIDAISIEQAGGKAIALNSATNDNKLISLIEQHKPKHKFIISLDNDKEGQEATKRIIEAMERMGTPHMTINIAGEYKDANEALQADGNAFTAAINEAIDQADPDQARSAAYYLDDFLKGITASIDTPAIPTGYSRLDKVLDGGLYEGLYIIGAISSLGKTTYILQMADQIAEQGEDVLIFSLEMARYELIAKSISRISFLKAKDKNHAKTVRGILSGKRYKNYSQVETQLIKQSIEDYQKYAANVYMIEGLGDVGAAQIRYYTEKHIQKHNKRPVIIIDYLQILAPYDMRATDKQNTDKAVLELKRISRDYKIPVMAISSFNRASYKDTVTMEAFKESGAIEYSSDVLIGLQPKGAGAKEFDIDAAKRKTPREIELKILKNRNGKTGDSLYYSFYPMFNYFIEESGEIDWND